MAGQSPSGTSTSSVLLTGLLATSAIILALILGKSWWASSWGSETRTNERNTTHRTRRAPAAHDERMTSDYSLVVEKSFEDACAAVEAVAETLSSPSLLEFYGLYKQATHGECADKEPSALNPVAHAKWSSWFAKKRLSAKTARAAYVQLARDLGILQPTLGDPPAGRRALGPVQSRPVEIYCEKNIAQSKGDEFCCHVACGDIDAVKRTLSEDPARVGELGEGRMSALHFAADRGLADIARLLIDHGADVNHTDDCGETPLHVAIAADQTKLISLLLKAGANTSARNNEGHSCAELLLPGGRSHLSC